MKTARIATISLAETGFGPRFRKVLSAPLFINSSCHLLLSVCVELTDDNMAAEQ
jgi:hypothetical protein